MKPTFALYSIATVLCLIAPLHAQRAAATPYLAEAKKLLPTVGLNLFPGDGGEVGEPKNLIFENLLPLYARLAFAQKQSGDVAGAQATYARGMALCTQKQGTYQQLVEVIVTEGLRYGFYNEAVAFSKKHDIDGYRACFIAEYEVRVRKDPKTATATLLAGIERGLTLEKTSGDSDADSANRSVRSTELFRLLDVAVRYNLTDAAPAARAAFAPLVSELSEMNRCRAVYLGVPGISADEAEAKLRQTYEKKPGILALGLFYLKKDTEARALLANIARNDDVAPALVLFLKPTSYVAALSRAKAPEDELDLYITLRYLEQEGRNTPDLLLALNESAFAAYPKAVPEMGSVSEALLLLPRATVATPTLKREAALQRAEFVKVAKEQSKKKWDRGSYEDSQVQSEYASRLKDLVPLDPTFVTTQLSKLTEPRYRVQVLIALAAYYAKK